ncbi:Arc family DNA-binding protein [Pseudomonas sp. DG56-2]|uniref:Arc family DNA-binding protein n=1 Tax=Pseudomonas sp. DG56-2 TaxID=2320270 RepID=UPI0010A5DCB7|nr:Arc family DNA-binding protein [Pseudomonas sp. DG56-2]
MNDRHTISPYPIRMPAELRASLEQSARDGSRSLHAEIIARLEESFRPSSGKELTVGDAINFLMACSQETGLPIQVTIGEVEKDGEGDDD